MATIRKEGIGGGVSGAAQYSQSQALNAALQSALARSNVTVYQNYETGSAAPSNFSVFQAGTLIRRGAVWVDYGQWPWGQAYVNPLGGFGAFLSALYGGILNAFGVENVPLGRAGGFASTSAALANAPRGLLSGATLGLAPHYQHTTDYFDFSLHDWTWAAALDGYPYKFGLPTTTPPDAGVIHPMPGAPIGTFSGGNPPQSVYVYSAFGIRVGRGWYFEAQPDIDPTAYARFIAQTLGVQVGPPPFPGNKLPSFINLGAPMANATAARASRAACLNVTVRQGSQGPYVAALQRALIARGFSVGPTGADGKFGPNTYLGLVQFQRSRAGQRNPCGTIVVDGVAGPAVWFALGVSAVPIPTSTVSTPTTTTNTTTRRAAALAQKPSPAGIWQDGKGYAVVGGQLVYEPSAPTAGGVIVVSGYKVHFPPMPASGTTPPAKKLPTLSGLLSEEAKALHTTPKVAEYLDIAAAAGVAILVATSGGGGK